MLNLPNNLSDQLLRPPSSLPNMLSYLKNTYNLILSGHTDAVTCLSHSTDLSLIATGSNDGTVRLWDRKLVSQLLFHRHHSDTVTSVCISSDNSFIITGSSDKSLIVFCIKTLKVKILNGHKRMIRNVCLTKNGKYAVSIAVDRVVKVWNLELYKLAFDFIGHLSQVCSMDIFENICATGDSKGLVHLWNVEQGEKICKLIDDSSLNEPYFVNFLKFVDSERLVAVSSFSKVLIWNVLEKSVMQIYKPELDSKIFAAFFNTFNDEILIFGKLRVIVSGIKHTEILENFPKDLECVEVDFSNGVIFAGHTDRTVKVYGMNGEVLQVMDGHLGHVQKVRVSSDCMKIVSCADDNTVRVWDLQIRKQIQCFELHKSEIYSVAFLMNGKFIVSCGIELIFYVWKV